ncbi:MAG: CBS domain-containing protein [Chloroflexi bacterium]|nr:CBS domain-containing protein [Chloroflexota bacterium]
MAIVTQLLHGKTESDTIWSIGPEATIYEALTLMANKNVGALMVVDDDQAVGVFSERDYARKVVLRGRSSKKTAVREAMASPVISVKTSDSVQTCMEKMTVNRIRHLLVTDNNGNMVGVISIGDVVKAVIAEQQNIIEHLEGYITG